MLWHYTNLAGLEGITASKTLWATDADFLNDAEEIRHAPKYLQAAWEGAARLAKEGGEDSFAPNDLPRILTISTLPDDVTVKVVLEDGPMPFVTSFCAEADLLSMWRAYATGEGCALGFNACDVYAVARCVQAELAPVHYADPWDAPNVSGAPDPATGELQVSRRQAAEIKHPGFIEEREYRLIVPGDTDLPVKYRRGAHGCTPYVEVPLGDCKPREVWVGPGANNQRIRGLQGLLEGRGWAGVEVTASDIPLR